MAKRTFTKLLISILSIPFIISSLIIEKANLWEINEDIKKCCQTIEAYKNTNIPSALWFILILAEDRRSYFHKGIDPIAMFRAIFIKITQNKFQGASTIEQQFVRVVSERYEKKLSRKLREQILALCVSRRYSKLEIAKAYLSIAFYGSGKIGLHGIKKLNHNMTDEVTYENAISIISRLKYPEPLKEKEDWFIKYSRRTSHIKDLLNDPNIIQFSMIPLINK